MEGRGFLEAVHMNSVLGRSFAKFDLLTGKSKSDKAGWQLKAADAASAVAFEMLATLKLKPSAAKAGADGLTSPRVTPSDVSSEPRASPAPPATTPSPAHHGIGPDFNEMPATLNEGSFFREGEVLARVGVPQLDEIQLSFRELPDSYIRIIPKRPRKVPIATADLNDVAGLAPLLKHRQFGGFKFVNRLGAMAYDPGGPHIGGPAPLSWAT